ncbi:MAG: hypothetical protein R2702_18870 [Acidimicrobiales bacterium]
MTTPVFAYLDAGAGAALAAVLASGAVGVRAVLGSKMDKVRRRGGRAPQPSTPDDPTTPSSSEGGER